MSYWRALVEDTVSPFLMGAQTYSGGGQQQAGVNNLNVSRHDCFLLTFSPDIVPMQDTDSYPRPTYLVAIVWSWWDLTYKRKDGKN